MAAIEAGGIRHHGGLPPPLLSTGGRRRRASIRSMDVRVVAFATASDVVGREPLTIAVEDGARLSDLARRLMERFPDLAPLWPRLAVAVDGTLANGDVALADGVEVALLPPVSGGAPPHVALVGEAIDPASVTAAVAGPRCGAVVLFLGTARDHHRGRAVAKLSYSAYRPMALAALERIARELADAHRASLAIVHRLGEVPIGEASVAIAAAAPHRQAAYQANREALERLKREVPIWKRELYADGEAVWREEESLAAAVELTS
ncbi:MAG: hypothetical protein D6696_11840 [Acidobacteria bacterium]|nr:MAG: hypothetical protein D6696_11840 [Acidobacteriota bacterium]